MTNCCLLFISLMTLHLAVSEYQAPDQVTTPASVMPTPGWQHVMGPLNPYMKYSDSELVKAWKAENALEGVAKLWKLTLEQVEKLSEL